MYLSKISLIMFMFCTRCGHVLEENMQFCPECGKKQFDLPSDNTSSQTEPYRYRTQVFIIAFVASFAIVAALNILGGGLFTFLFLPFIFFGGKSSRTKSIVNGVCWGFICGALTSIILKMMGMY